MENQTEKKMENEMETEGILGVRELNLSFYIGETLLFTTYTHSGNLICVPSQQPRVVRIVGVGVT